MNKTTENGGNNCHESAIVIKVGCIKCPALVDILCLHGSKVCAKQFEKEQMKEYIIDSKPSK